MLRHGHSLFLITYFKDMLMDKRKAIQIMTKSARLYKENLEDKKILFLYGVPSEVKKELQKEEKNLFSLRGYEVAFHRYNFLHLTGVKINSSETASAIHFYEKCLSNRLTENDFGFAGDGSTGQKLDILKDMMLIKRNATMIGDFAGRGPKLFAEFEKDCARKNIDQFYLIRATNEDANRFYNKFKNVELSEVPVLRKYLKK